MNVVFIFGMIYFLSFWVILIIRIATLHRIGIKTLTLSTKSGLKNLISMISFFGAISLYNIIFLMNSVISNGFFLFLSFWNVQLYPWLMILFFLLAIAFQVFMYTAIFQMGVSWRVGIDDQQPNKLVTNGVFSISRNPIFFGLNGIIFSLFLIQPNIFNLVFVFMVILGIHLQVLKEEKHLKDNYGKEYIEYTKKTKRYFLLF